MVGTLPEVGPPPLTTAQKLDSGFPGNGMTATFHYQCTQAMPPFTAGLMPGLPTGLTFFQLDRSAGRSAGDS